jgi:hypothetical protein
MNSRAADRVERHFDARIVHERQPPVEIRYQVAAVYRESATSDGLRDEQSSMRITGCEVLSGNV